MKLGKRCVKLDWDVMLLALLLFVLLYATLFINGIDWENYVSTLVFIWAALALMRSCRTFSYSFSAGHNRRRTYNGIDASINVLSCLFTFFTYCLFIDCVLYDASFDYSPLRLVTSRPSALCARVNNRCGWLNSLMLLFVIIVVVVCLLLS